MAHLLCDLHEHGKRSNAWMGLEILDSLDTEEVPVMVDPVEDLFHESRIMLCEPGRREEKSLWIDYKGHKVITSRAGEPDRDPLVPEKALQRIPEGSMKRLKCDLHSGVPPELHGLLPRSPKSPDHTSAARQKSAGSRTGSDSVSGGPQDRRPGVSAEDRSRRGT